MSSDKIVLSCNNLSKSFFEGANQLDILKCINLEIKEGELVGIVGASGSGKSTLMHLLGGLDKPNSGSVSWFPNGNKVDVFNLSEEKKCALRNNYLGFVYQFHHLLPEFNALENVVMPLLIGETNIKESIEWGKHLLKEIGLENRMKHKIGELSGGERQRVAIARAIVSNPSCVLADEPTGNLDGKTAAKVFENILTMHHKLKTSFLIVTHDHHLANQMDKVYKLEDGVFLP